MDNLWNNFVTIYSGNAFLSTADLYCEAVLRPDHHGTAEQNLETIAGIKVISRLVAAIYCQHHAPGAGAVGTIQGPVQ